jgi:hypothetical protein
MQLVFFPSNFNGISSIYMYITYLDGSNAKCMCASQIGKQNKKNNEVGSN